MIIYSASLEDFYHDSIYNEIADNIEKSFDRAGISHNNIREYHSFQNSYRALALLLMTSKTIDKSAKVAIEFRIPGINGPRIDFLITGKDEHGAKMRLSSN